MAFICTRLSSMLVLHFKIGRFFLFVLCLLPRCEITYTLINEIQAEQTREELLLFCFHAINPANFQKK